jgi:hypothetical protein
MYSKMPTHPYIVYIRIFLYFYIFIFLLTIYDMIREPGIFNIIYSVKIIKPKLLCGLIEDEIYKLEKDLSICEDYTKNLAMYSIYMKNIIPDNIPDDLTNMIFEKL